MQLPPPSVLEKWPVPNLINPERTGPSAIITVAVLLGIVTLLLVVRVYTRVHISRGFGLDDVLILLAYLPTVAFGIVSIVAQCNFSWGLHIWDVSFALFQPGLQISLSLQLLFALATSLTKLSMLSLIYRVVSVDRSRYRFVVVTIACIVALDGLIFFFVTTFQCSPISAYWTLSATPQHCINEVIHLLAAGCINTTTDFIIVLVPIPYVMRLNFPRKQQIIIASLFAGGLFATAAGAVRTYVTFIAYSDVNRDRTWSAIPVIITSVLELYIGIICASIPPIKPFFARYLPILIGNPKHWLTGQCASQHRAAGASSSVKNPDGDFWMVTVVDDSGESATLPGGRPESPLIMQMQPTPSKPGMPTPTRPPRTQSTLRSIPSMYRPQTSSSNKTSGWASITPSTASTLYASESSLARQTSLNKPLPRIPSATRRDWLNLADEEDMRQSMRKSTPPNMLSVYQFVPHEDGHISVVRTRSNKDVAD